MIKFQYIELHFIGIENVITTLEKPQKARQSHVIKFLKFINIFDSIKSKYICHNQDHSCLRLYGRGVLISKN